MDQKDEILSKLSEMAAEISSAREQLLKGELVAIDNVHERLEIECQRIVDLEPEDAVAIKPQMDALLADLRLFSEEIEYVQAKVAEILKDAQQNTAEDGAPDSKA